MLFCIIVTRVGFPVTRFFNISIPNFFIFSHIPFGQQPDFSCFDIYFLKPQVYHVIMFKCRLANTLNCIFVELIRPWTTDISKSKGTKQLTRVIDVLRWSLYLYLNQLWPIIFDIEPFESVHYQNSLIFICFIWGFLRRFQHYFSYITIWSLG